MTRATPTPPVRQSPGGAERILTIVQDLGPGGTQRSAENNAIAYHNAGRASAVFARFKGGDRAQRIEDAGCPVFLPDPDKGETDPELISRIAQWCPSVIQFHRMGHPEPSCGELLRALAHKLGHRVPTAELSHFGRSDRSPDRHLFDVHMQLSPVCLWRWRNWSRWLSPKPVGVAIPHMIDTDRFFPASNEEARAFRDEHNIPRDAFVFVRVGQPHPSKWTEGTVHAFAKVAAQEPNAYLVLVGAPKKVLNAVDELDDETKRRVVVIDFLNGDPALRACYTACDLFLHTALVGETLGLVLAESMACGTPCITVSTPKRDNSQGWVVGHQDAGIVVAYEHMLPEHMLKLMREPEKLAALAARARPRVLQNFHRDRIISDALHVLDAAARHAGDPRALTAELAQRPDLMPKRRPRTHEPMFGTHTTKDLLTATAKETPFIYGLFSKRKRNRTQA